MCTKKNNKITGKPILRLACFVVSFFDLFNIAALTVFFISIAIVIGPNFIKGDMIKEGAVVIDVGIKRLDRKSTRLNSSH